MIRLPALPRFSAVQGQPAAHPLLTVQVPAPAECGGENPLEFQLITAADRFRVQAVVGASVALGTAFVVAGIIQMLATP